MRILIIDDDPAMTQLLRLILDATGYEINVTNSSQKGLSLVQEGVPDIIIMNLLMPDTDGGRVCREIRAISSAPILVLSALNSPSLIASLLYAGADDYLVKPVPNAVLLTHIQNLVKRNMPVYAAARTGSE